MNRPKEPLYRRNNKHAANYHHNIPPGKFKDERNKKFFKRFEGTHLAMSGKDRGRDYTPLYKFLLSKVGQKWDDVFSEAVARLDRVEPIFYLVVLDIPSGRRPVVRIGESSYYSMLTVNHEGILVRVDDETPHLIPTCTCCTISFNGKPFPKGTHNPSFLKRFPDYF